MKTKLLYLLFPLACLASDTEKENPVATSLVISSNSTYIGWSLPNNVTFDNGVTITRLKDGNWPVYTKVECEEVVTCLRLAMNEAEFGEKMSALVPFGDKAEFVQYRKESVETHHKVKTRLEQLLAKWQARLEAFAK